MSKIKICELQQAKEDNQYASSLGNYNKATNNALIVESVDLDVHKLPDNICASDHVINVMLQKQSNKDHDDLLKRTENQINDSSEVLISNSNYCQTDYNDNESDSDDEIIDAHPGPNNNHKSMSFPMEYLSENDASLNLEAHLLNEQARSHKIHDKKDHTIPEKDIDEYTRTLLYQLIDKQVLKSVNGIMSFNKQAVILHANSNSKEYTIKVFKSMAKEFKAYKRKIKKFRSKILYGKKNCRRMEELWAEQEVHNLIRIKKAGILCPEVIALQNHILVMSFIGENRLAAPKLKDAVMNFEDKVMAYEQIVNTMKILYDEANLILVKLSEHNILWYKGQCWFANAGQAVKRTSSNMHVLYKDCNNISTFFNRHNIPEVKSPEELFFDISGFNDYVNKKNKHRVKQENLAKEILKLTTYETEPKPKSILTSTSNIDQSSDSSDLINCLKKEPINIDNDKVLPISSLSPSQYKCVIKARVTNKSSIRTWSISDEEGEIFYVDLCDESGEIRAYAFIEGLFEKFYNFIEIDRVYYISKFLVDDVNQQFSIVKNDYEIIFGLKTIVIPCSDKINLPENLYKFVPIEKISKSIPGSVIDVIGVCKDSGQVQTFTAKRKNCELKKREVTLVDQTHSSITLTLWDTEAENFNASPYSVLAIRAARVKEFQGGMYIGITSYSVMTLNPNIPKSGHLRRWFDNYGKYEKFVNLSTKTKSSKYSPHWVSCKQVYENCFGSSKRGDYYELKATILMIKQTKSLYKGCPIDHCSKKLMNLENGMYRCEKCNREYPNFKYRLSFMMIIADSSDTQWVRVFTSTAEKILGVTSQELGQESETNEKALSCTFQQAHFREFFFKCRAKLRTYYGQTELNNVLVEVNPINFKNYNSYLITEIRELMGS